MATVINESMFPDLVACYNKEGKVAAYNYLRTQFGLKHPEMVFSRIKKSGKFLFDPATGKFSPSKQLSNEDAVFIGLDALCNPPGKTSIAPEQNSFADERSAAMEKLIHELLGDRLLALSHYISMDSVNRTVIIDQSSLQADGYRIMTH